MQSVTDSDHEDAAWRVTISRVGDDRVVRLFIGKAIAVLPALEAHKLGSALQAASGIDTRGDKFWHCRCGVQYGSAYRACPSCGEPGR